MDFQFETIDYRPATFREDVLPLLPRHPAVFKIYDIRGQLMILDRTHDLNQRLERYYRDPGPISRDLDLSRITGRIEFHRTYSPFETVYLLYRERRRSFPATYRDLRTFRLFYLMKINRRQRFPRIYASREIKPGVDYFGPFLNRSQLDRVKTRLERTFQLRPCPYNIRGDDPRPDCLYFQMHTCSRPCNNDIDQLYYLENIQRAMAFIEGREAALETQFESRIAELAHAMRFEEAEIERRKLERLRQARLACKDTFYSVRHFNLLALMPAASPRHTTIAFIREGYVLGFEDYGADSLDSRLRADIGAYFNGPLREHDSQRQYDEFCLVSNFVVSPVDSVGFVPASPTDESLEAVAERIGERERKRVVHAEARRRRRATRSPDA